MTNIIVITAGFCFALTTGAVALSLFAPSDEVSVTCGSVTIHATGDSDTIMAEIAEIGLSDCQRVQEVVASHR